MNSTSFMPSLEINPCIPKYLCDSLLSQPNRRSEMIRKELFKPRRFKDIQTEEEREKEKENEKSNGNKRMKLNCKERQFFDVDEKMESINGRHSTQGLFGFIPNSMNQPQMNQNEQIPSTIIQPNDNSPYFINNQGNPNGDLGFNSFNSFNPNGYQEEEIQPQNQMPSGYDYYVQMQKERMMNSMNVTEEPIEMPVTFDMKKEKQYVSNYYKHLNQNLNKSLFGCYSPFQ
ncbi:MAG: hypothetical protein MJ252_01945 [archaeon]|nr:hypothetical protein [archaeon]